MLDNILQEYIENNITFTGELYNEEAPTGATLPYFVMRKISDPERPFLLCEEQGAAGDARFQFDYFDEQTQSYVKMVHQEFKEQIKNISGVIGTTEQYRIWNNQISAVLALPELDVSAPVRGATFDIKIKWEAI
jgi:hypothetical protein